MKASHIDANGVTVEHVQVRLPISRYTPTEFQVTGGTHPQLQVYGEHIAVALTAAGDEHGALDEQDATAAKALMQAATEYHAAVRARITNRQPE